MNSKGRPVRRRTGTLSNWTYVRFHGPNSLEHPNQGQYGKQRLFWMAERITSRLAQGIAVCAYFNNDDFGFAVN